MTLTCREWDYLTVDQDGLSEHLATRFYTLANVAARRLKLRKDAVLARSHHRVRVGQVVGILATGGASIEILPKVDGSTGAVRKALVRMLAAAWNLPVAAGELASLDTQRRDLLELLIGLFAQRLLKEVRRGLPRRYLSREQDLTRLRGKLNIKRQFTRLVGRPDLLACRFDDLSEDTPLNRVFKAAVWRLWTIARTDANTRLLAELLARLEFVGDSNNPLQEPVRLDRTNIAFHDLHRFARLFLSGDWQNTTGGKTEGFALLFPMNDLFERFIARCLERVLSPDNVQVKDRRYFALTNKLFQLEPDIVALTNAGDVVIDTKWKALKPEKLKQLGVDHRDIYQMLAYAQAYQAHRLVLIYPWQKELGQKEIIRHWRVSGTSCLFDIATVDVGNPDAVPDTLRRIVAHG